MTQVDRELLWWGIWAVAFIFWIAVVVEYIMEERILKKNDDKKTHL